MKKIKSYTSIWSVEKVIYAINDFQLPFPLTFSQMAWFVVSLFVVILFGELPPFNMIDGAFLKYFGIPVAFTWFVSQKTFDGKKPFGFLKSCVSFFLRPKVTYPIDIDGQTREHIISLGKEQIITNQIKQHSYFNLFLSTLRFISVRSWIAQFIILICAIFITSNLSSLHSINEIMQILTFILIVSILFFIDELFKSFTTGMWELEQTLKYELRQHTIVKLLIMGLIDMILVFLMSIIVQPTLSISLLNILLYLLVPYNLICIILFSILTMWRNKMYNYVLWFASGSIGVAFILVTNIFNVYEQKIVYWAVTYLLTTIILGHIIYSQARTIRLEVA